jgi:hypothetical protein
MKGIENRSLTTPDEVRRPDRAVVEMVHLAAGDVGRYTFQPGWHWAESVKPVVGTESCQVEHLGYVISGQLRVRHNDGTEVSLNTGDVYRIAPGHDGWTVGDQPAVVVEFQGAATFARA